MDLRPQTHNCYRASIILIDSPLFALCNSFIYVLRPYVCHSLLIRGYNQCLGTACVAAGQCAACGYRRGCSWQRTSTNDTRTLCGGVVQPAQLSACIKVAISAIVIVSVVDLVPCWCNRSLTGEWCGVTSFGSVQRSTHVVGSPRHQTVVPNQCWNRDEFSPRLNERSVRSDERNASCSLSCSLFHVGGPLRGSCVDQLRSGRVIKCPRRRRAHLLNANLWNRRAREIQRRQMMPLMLPRQLLATTIDGRTRLGMASTSDATSLRVDLRRGSVGSKWHRLASHPSRLRPTRFTAAGDR